MKKVGIITFHNAHNYGAILQVYALQEKLKELGFLPSVINYKNKKITRPYSLIKYSKKNPVKSIKLLYESIKDYRINKLRYDTFNNFINQKLDLTKEYKDIKSLKNDSPKMDYYITGSDQVWNTSMLGELSDAYTLNFGDNKVKRVAYAASIGNASIDENFKEQYKEKISKIDYISVREKTAAEELKKIIDKKISIVLDPTLLFSKEEWDKKIKKENDQKEKYILAYVVKYNDEYRKIVDYVSEKTGFKVIHFNKKNIYKNELESAYTVDPFEFVNKIKNAEYVIATSFHAMVFSILYHKKFFIIPHNTTGSRITDLLEKLNIDNRVYYNLEEFSKINYDLDIDYKKIDEKLNKERNESIRFLLESMKD